MDNKLSLSGSRLEVVQSRLARGLAAVGMFLLLLSNATPAAAHDNLGGDEMSMAIAIFIVGCMTIVGAALAILWGIKTGQFSDVERAKYTMLENADDLDDLPQPPG
ncbi:MAG TPA: cbb3-type cytochrome oxidase assembly protein [Chloroflexia bacterium]|nr:cbb3-type cytochrome oxidase assembly protein [Chloroflexia bacterium]